METNIDRRRRRERKEENGEEENLLDDRWIHLLYSPWINLQLTPYIFSYPLYFLNLIRGGKGTMTFLVFPHCYESAHIWNQDQEVDHVKTERIIRPWPTYSRGQDEGRGMGRKKEKVEGKEGGEGGEETYLEYQY